MITCCDNGDFVLLDSLSDSYGTGLLTCGSSESAMIDYAHSERYGE